MSDGVALDKKAWWQHLNGYHWYVFILAAMGWLFDCMDQQIFTASRSMTMADLMRNASEDAQRQAGTYCTMLFIFGWATGGLVFGVVGDRWGRAKTMALTIMIYAVFTGFSAFARTWQEFGICRFLTGLGVGGEFAAGTALVAEVMPPKARAQALGMLQALSAVGNILGAAMLEWIVPHWGWQGLYWVGAVPALLAVVVRVGLKEPDTWVAAKEASKKDPASEGKAMGSFSHLFTHPRWRRSTITGLGLAISGVLVLWGVGFYSPELIDTSFPEVSIESRAKIESIVNEPSGDGQKKLIAELNADDRIAYGKLLEWSMKPGEVFDKAQIDVPLNDEKRARVAAALKKSMPKNEKTALKSRALIFQQIGAFFGIMVFGSLAAKFGRRPAFFMSFLFAWAVVAYVFYGFRSPEQIYYLYPLLGFATLAPFGGYALYFPELYPTRLRTTGISFCYNVGRYAGAFGPVVLGYLSTALKGKYETAGFRLAAIIVASSYILGLVILIWAPETKDQPLPEEEGVPKSDEPVLAH